MEVGKRREEAVLTQPKDLDLISEHTSTLCPFPQQHVKLASETGHWKFSLVQNFFQEKFCLKVEILLLYQDKTSPGGCWAAETLQYPKLVTTSPKGQCPFGTNPGSVSADQSFSLEECLLMFIQICCHFYFWFGHLPSGIFHNCSSNNYDRR